MVNHMKYEFSFYKDTFIPSWNQTLMELAKEVGLKKGGWGDHSLIKPYDGKKLDVRLPEGYTIIDGNTTPAF